MNENVTLTIPEERFGEFDKRMKRLRRKAVKLDVDLPDFKTTGFVFRPSEHDARLIEAGRPATDFPHYEYRVVEVWNVESVRVDGFDLVAKVEPSPVEGVNLITSGHGVDTHGVEQFRKADLTCEHCNTKRQRKHTFVVRDRESGSLHLVGRNCLADFIGHPNAVALAKFWLSIGELDEGERWCNGGTPTMNLLFVTEWTAACIEQFGWRSRGSAYDEGGASTADTVFDAIYRKGQFEQTKHNRFPTPVPEITDEHKEQARAAVDWIRSVSPDPIITTSDYLLNLRLACEGDFFSLKHQGLVCSLLIAHRNYLIGEERKTKQAQEREARAVDHENAAPVPDTDERVEVIGEVVGAKWKSTDFGDTLKIIVRHADGWRVWGSCPKALGQDESEVVGKTVRFVARIQRSNDDAKFGFFNRPTKATLVVG